MGEDTDADAERVIESSHLIFIYGMSIGQTDRRWWEKIIQKMTRDTKMFLIIHDKDAPIVERIPVFYMNHQKETRERFMRFGGEMKPEIQRQIMERIFVTGVNTFECLSGLVTDKMNEMDKYQMV